MANAEWATARRRKSTRIAPSGPGDAGDAAAEAHGWPASPAWKRTETKLNRAATCRGCAALWACLLLGFSPALLAVLGVTTVWASDALGLSSSALAPLPSTAGGGRAATPWDVVSPQSLRALRMEAVQFALHHPGVKVINGANPRRDGPAPGAREGAGLQAGRSAKAVPVGEPLGEHGGAFDDADFEELGVSSTDPLALVPRLVHQTWKDHEVPARWRGSHAAWVASWGEERPFTLLLWSDAALEDFVDRFFPWFGPHYRAYGVHIQRVDAARYFLLYAMGGIYADLDVGFRRSSQWQDVLRSELTLPTTEPLGLSNDFMAGAPGHPFFGVLCRRLLSPLASPRWIYTRFFTVMFSTGPSFVSTQLVGFRLARSAQGLPAEVYPVVDGGAGAGTGGAGGVLLLAPTLYDSGADSIVGHVHGASWHDTSTSLLWQWYDMLPEAVALPAVIVGITLAIVAMVVGVVCVIGWAPCCLRREARALLCCLYTSLLFSVCCGGPERPCCCCEVLAEPIASPPDNPRMGRAVAAARMPPRQTGVV